MKIYTKTGDSGDTSLFGGGRVSKDAPRIEAFGTIDEVNSLLGSVRAEPLSEQGDRILSVLQQQLFVVGSDVATPQEAKNPIDRIGDTDISRLEEWIDMLEEELPTLKNFILPGGNRSAATLHLARSTCRRAERLVITARREEVISDQVLIYLNRLSDLLFVLARFENRQAGNEETIWNPRS